jgi:predicted exporter
VKTRSVAPLGLAALLFLVMGAFTARHLELSAGLTHFLSAESEVRLASLSAQIADSTLTRTMILSVGAPAVETAAAAAQEWERVLESHPETASVRSGPSDAFASAVFQLYFPRRLLFLSSRPEAELGERFSDAGLRAAARALRDELALPEAQLTKGIAAADPLLAFPAMLRRFEAARLGGMRVIDGHFVDAEASHAILFLTTRHSAFDAEHQAPFADFIERSFGALDADFGGVLSLERSAVHRFAAASERLAREDMTRISAVSLAGIAVLFLAVFRSPFLLLVSLLPLAGGILTATSAGILLFGELHVITLVFGATLIGVCIDYPIHYITHHSLLPAAGGPFASLRRLWPALAMGALTTVAGFAGLAWSGLPGVREIGVFSAVGVLAALVTTAAVLPPLMPRSPRSVPLQRSLAGAFATLLSRLQRRRGILLAIPLAAAALCAVGLPRVVWDDDLYVLNVPLEPEWVAEDERVRGRVSRMDASRFVVALGNDDEEALRRNDAVYTRLTAAREAGLLEDFRSLHTFLWSEDLQTRNVSAVKGVPELFARTSAALEAEGFRPEAFAPFAAALREETPEPLGFRELLDSPLAPLVESFRVQLDDGVGLITFLRGVKDPAGRVASIAGREHTHYFDQQQFLAELYGRYREKTSALIVLGLVAVLGLLYLRYRRVSLSLAAAAPALLAAASTLALVSLSGSPINLLHLLGLLLVLSFGVDYGIFLLETRAHSESMAAALLSIAIACTSTCLAFGLLAASSFPALRALGTTTGLGVLMSLILAPTALLLARGGEKAP